MRHAGTILADVLRQLEAALEAGHHDRRARRDRRADDPGRGGGSIVPGLRRGARPGPVPGSICASINDEVVHGIPSAAATHPDR